MSDNPVEDPKMPALIRAVIQTESSGKPSAVSKTGAVGLMQLEPATGKEWHDKLKLPGQYNPKDPEQNVRIGSAYLEWLLEQFDGDLPLALTAYHSGIGRVKNLLTATKGSTLADIKSRLGPEGRTYAKKVMAQLTKLGGGDITEV